MDLEAKEHGKLETMEIEDVHTLRSDNYQQWKENMKYSLMKLDFFYLVCNDFTKISPLVEEVQKNNKPLSDVVNSILSSNLNRVMHYATTNEVCDKLKEIHEEKPNEGCSSKELLGKIISNASKDEHDDKITFVRSNGIINLEEDRLEEIFDLRRKNDLALKNTINLKYKL